MNYGKYIFTQIAGLIKMTPFRKLVKKYGGDYRVHDSACYNQFLHLLFGQLSSCTSVVGDCIVELARKGVRNLYPDELRFVRAIDPETGEVIDFMTDNFELSALEIANIYRHRWDIEVFFRWIKQNIVIKKLWGYFPNAVKTHLWVAICAFLLLAWAKKPYQSDYSITETATLVSVSLFEKADLKELLALQNDKLGYSNLKAKLTIFNPAFRPFSPKTSTDVYQKVFDNIHIFALGKQYRNFFCGKCKTEKKTLYL